MIEENIPKTRLMALQWLDLGKLIDNETKFRIEWKKNKKCKCVDILEIGQLPWCEHVRKEFDKKCKGEINKIWDRNKNIFLQSLPNNEAINQKFH